MSGMKFESWMSDADGLMFHIERDPVLRSTILSVWVLDRAPDENEQQYYAYAVPERYGVTGRRTVYVDESQVVRIADAGPTALVTREQGLRWAAAPLTFAESLQ